MIAGVVLAGGRSSRMGRDKATVRLAGTELVDRALSRLAPQVSVIAVNANIALELVAARGIPVLSDTVAGFEGPLAGMLTALDWAVSAGAEKVATVPVDTPFFPQDFVAQLNSAATAGQIVIARSQGRLHPTCALFPASSASNMRDFLDSQSSRRVMDFLDLNGFVAIDFDTSNGDPFFNINRPEDLVIAEDRIRLTT